VAAGPDAACAPRFCGRGSRRASAFHFFAGGAGLPFGQQLQFADRSRFRCTDPESGCAAAASALSPARGSARPVFESSDAPHCSSRSSIAMRIGGARTAIGEMSHITRILENVPEVFYAPLAVPTALLGLLQIQPVHQHRQLFGPHRHAARVSLLRASEKRPFSSRFRRTPTNPLPSHTNAFSLVRVAIREQKQMPAQRILLQVIAHQPVQPLEPFGACRCLRRR